MTITEFLNARYDEDEATARAVTDAGGESDWRAHPVAELEGRRALTGGSFIFAVVDPVPEGPACADHAARHDPARVLREIAAKRAVLALASEALGDDTTVPDAEFMAGEIVKALASVYSDHPDYQQEWAP